MTLINVTLNFKNKCIKNRLDTHLPNLLCSRVDLII